VRVDGTPRPSDYIKVTIFGVGLSVLWTSLHTIIIPIRLLDIAPEAQKNTYLGLLTFSGLILAMLIQPVAGALSDRFVSPFGRRRPFIFVGTLLALLLLPTIGISDTFCFLFLSYCSLQLASNIAQGPFQAFIPDFIPKGHRGTASGVKSLLEILFAVLLLRLIAYFMDTYVVQQHSLGLWISLAVPGLIMLATMTATLLTVNEQRPDPKTQISSAKAITGAYKIDTKRDLNFVWFLASRLFILMAMGTLQTFALYFLRDVVQAPNPAGMTADLLITVGIFLLLVVYPAGRFSDKFGRHPLIFFSGFTGILGILIIYFSPTYTGVLICGGLLGISTGTFLSTNWALATDLALSGEEARYLGLTNLATAGAGALSRLTGPVIDFFNNKQADLGYSIMLIICITYFIIGSTLVILIREKTGRNANTR